jgi:hypothetical protein
MKKLLLSLPVALVLAAGCTAATQSFRSVRNPAAGGETVAAVVPVAQCPAGYILVPGSSLYGTPDFCAMKYDAKAALTSAPTVGLQPKPGDPCSGESSPGHPYGVYKNSGKGCAATSQNGKVVVSVPSGFPITYVPETGNGADNAKTYCANAGGHLITNPEWMTIARNVEQVPANWCSPNGTGCGAQPGTSGKILASGHSNALPNAALVASADDAQACFGTATNGSDTCGGPNSEKRTLTLGNNEVIWDFAGNVWQWVDGTVQRRDEPQSVSAGKLDTGWLSSEFAPGGSGALASVITGNGSGPSLGYNSFRPSNPTWNSANGVGRMFHYSSANDTSTTVYTFIRGGQWNHGAVDGAFSMHLTPIPTTMNIDDVGFRCTVPVSPGG